MNSFEAKMRTYFKDATHSLYDIALDVGLDPSNTTKILYKKRPTYFDTRLDVAKKISESPLMELPYEIMARWLAEEYLPLEVLAVGEDFVSRLGPDAVAYEIDKAIERKSR